MFSAMGEALSIMATPAGLAMLLAATIVGTAVAILPGIGATTTLAIFIPVSLAFDSTLAIMFMSAIIAAGGFAGSVTAILLAIPGDSTNAATVADGYGMTKAGKAGVAIGASATASLLGALFGLLVLVSVLPFIRSVILLFGQPEILVLALGGILLLGLASGNSPLRGVIGGLLGMAASFVGYNYALGGVRFTGGMTSLYDGIPEVAVLIGLFAFPELAHMIRRQTAGTRIDPKLGKGQVWEGVKETLRRPGLVLRSAAIGTGLGVVPGIGGNIPPWVSLGVAKKMSKNPESFGKGNVEGVIAPDATSDAKDGGQLMPTLALGIPGGLATALLLSAFLLHGVTPGRQLLSEGLPMVFVIIFAMVFVNVASSLTGLVAARHLVRVAYIQPNKLVPVVTGIAFVGAYVAIYSHVGLVIVVLAGLLGIVFEKFDYSRAAFILGLLLMPIVEQGYHVSRQLSRGSHDFLMRPMVFWLLVAMAVMVILPQVLKMARARGAFRVRNGRNGGTTDATGGRRAGRRRASETDALDTPVSPAVGSGTGTAVMEATDPVGGSVAVVAEESESRKPWWGAELLAAGFFIVVASAMLWSTGSMRADQRLVPQIVLIPLLVLLVVQFVSALRALDSESRTPINWPAVKQSWVPIAVLCSFPVMIYLLDADVGLGIATFASVLAVSYVCEGRLTRKDWIWAVALGVLAPVFIYYGLSVALGVRLPGGLF